LGHRATNGFALVLHELATNAAKYGALKADAGSVQVSWRREGDQLVLTWQERGGPAIDGEPTKQGFGTVLSKNTVVGQLGGTLRNDWQPTGLVVTMSVPMENLWH
jgi:two-component sensor histidine kinase